MGVYFGGGMNSGLVAVGEWWVENDQIEVKCEGERGRSVFGV